MGSLISVASTMELDSAVSMKEAASVGSMKAFVSMALMALMALMGSLGSFVSFVLFVSFDSLNPFVSLDSAALLALLASFSRILSIPSLASSSGSSGLDRSESETTSKVNTCGVREDCAKLESRGNVGAEGGTSVESVSEEVDRETSSKRGKRWEEPVEEQLWRYERSLLMGIC